MKFVLASIALVLVLVSWESTARNLPGKAPRTFGNFGPKVKRSYQTFQPSATSASFNVDPVSAAVAFFAHHAKTTVGSIKVSSSHKASHNGVTHVYLRQVINGLEVVNGVGNVNVDKNGQILSVGNSFYTGPIPARNFHLQHTASDAVRSLAKLLNKDAGEKMTEVPSVTEGRTTVSGAAFALADIPAAVKYIQVEGGASLKMVWDIEVEMKDNMYNAFVAVDTEEVVSLIDWVADASYNILPLGTNDPHSGDRVLVVDPATAEASPLGWHSQSTLGNYTGTVGNNVYAQVNPDGADEYLDNYRPDGGNQLVFDFPVDLEKDPDTYVDAAVTNLFYWNNVIHDLFFAYGFNEESGNFQEVNFGTAGAGGDAVIAMAQDGSGYNNANFMTPRDGSKGRMRMYVWTVTDPWRDGDLDGGIVMHEYCHGISNRLTGGPDDVGCLGFGESGGMGEGWGDVFATITRTNASTTREQNYGMGDYSNGGEGIRNYLYSTNMETNPSTYSYVVRPGYSGVHAKGEVWAVILYEVYWNLVELHGFDPDWFNTNPEDVKTEGTYKSLIDGQTLPRPARAGELGGNVIFFQLVVDGMKLQPCDPTFVEARDAILQADLINNNGENQCALWKGFAKRGLGENARYEGVDGFNVPASCQ